MDFREARYKVLRSETMTNIWYTDTEGWLMPRGVPLWGSIDAANPIYWRWTGNVAGNAAVRLGGQWLGAMIDTTLVGTGAATAFGPITFPNTPLQVGFTSVWTVIGGAQYSWHDDDGTPETFTGIVHAIGTGAVGPYAFTSKAIALATSSVSVNWTSGGTDYSVTDNGAGIFADVKIAASAINYATGAISVTFAGGFPPDASTEISLSGTTATTFDVLFRERMAIGDGSNVTFTITAENKRLRPGSFLFSYVILGTTYYAQDNGAGTIVDLLGAHVQAGSVVNYVTGVVTLILGTAPDQNTNIDVVYNKLGLVSSSINYGTGAVSLGFATGSEPDNSKTIFVLSSWRDHSDFAGIDVVTGIAVMNQASKRIHLRDARGYLDVASEGYDGEVYPHYCKPFDIFSMAAYIRRYNGSETGYLRIRFWDGTSAYTQVSAGTTEWDSYSKFSGNFSVVDDPYNPGHNVYQFAITGDARHDKLAFAFQVPAGARAFSVEFETDSVGTQEGDQIFSLSGLYLSQGTTAMSYSPPSEIVYLPRPTDDSGQLGRVLTWDVYGQTKWVDPQLLGVAAIATLNGLSASIQNFGIGVAGNSPSWSSAINTHTLNIPYASTVGVTGGLVSYANWANWQNMAAGTFNQAAAPNTFTRELIPSVDNSIDVGTTIKRWRNLYAVNVYADTLVQVGGAINYGRFSVVATDLVATRAGTVVGFDLTAFTTVKTSLLTATTVHANRLYSLGSSDSVHLEVIGHTVQTSNIFNIQNQSGSAYIRGNSTMAIAMVGNFSITNNAAGVQALLLKAAAGQSADIFAVQDPSGDNLIAVDPSGDFNTRDIIPNVDNVSTLGFTDRRWTDTHTQQIFVHSMKGLSPAAGVTNLAAALDSTGRLYAYKVGNGFIEFPAYTSLTTNLSVVDTSGVSWIQVNDSVQFSGELTATMAGSDDIMQFKLSSAMGSLATNSFASVTGTGICTDFPGGAIYPIIVKVVSGEIVIQAINPTEVNFPIANYVFTFSGNAKD